MHEQKASPDAGRPASRHSSLLRGFSLVISCVLALVLGFNLYFPLASWLSGDPYPGLLGLRRAVVLSNSMAPALEAGDLIIIRSEPAYQAGDILTYRDGRSLVTHRLIAESADGLVLQGDANRSPDRPVPPGQVLGKTILRLPAAGGLAQWLRSFR